MFKLEPSVSRSSEDFEQTIKSCLQRCDPTSTEEKRTDSDNYDHNQCYNYDFNCDYDFVMTMIMIVIVR